MRSSAALMLLFAANCGLQSSLPPLTCPGKGGAAWTEITSPHIVLRTDHAMKDARALSDELEQTYDTLEQTFRRDLPAVAPPVDRVRVTVFARSEDVEALHPQFAGVFNRGGNAWERRPSIVMFDARDWHTRTLLRHELTHRFVAHYLPTAAQWLNEGLAEVYSTAHVSGGKVEVGAWDPDLYKHGYQPNVRELFAADYSTFGEKPGYYTEAHALVHLLQSERRAHRPRFEALLRNLADGMRADIAWREAFRGVDLDALEQEVNGYRFIVLRTDTRWFHATPSSPVEPRVRALSDAEVHLLWVELRSWRSASDRAKVESDLEQAQRAAPNPPGVHYWRACFRRARSFALSEMKRALEEDPDNPEFLLPVVELAPSPSLTERLAKLATTAEQWYAVGHQLVLPHATDEGLAALRKSVVADPACNKCWLMLAWAAHDAQRLDEAARAMQRAVWLQPDSAELLEALRDYLADARSAGVSLPPPPFGELVIPPARTRGLVVEGRVIEAGSGAPVDAMVHLSTRGEYAMARTDASGRFSVTLTPGYAELAVFPSSPEVLADRWFLTLAPSQTTVDVGVHKVVAGRTRWPMVAVDGIGAVSREGRAFVRALGHGSPAESAGIRVGDALVKVNGHDVTDLGPNAIDLYLAGDIGAHTEVVVEPNGTGPARAITFQLAPTR